MKELQAKAKVTQTMTRDGLVVENQADGTVENVSSREAEQDYSTDAEGKAEKILERAEDIKDGHKNKKKAKKAAETAATAKSEDGLHRSAARLELTEDERADPELQPYIHKAEAKADKLDAARAALPKKRVPVKEKVYDAASGKAKSTLRFEQQDKGPPSLKPNPASRPLSEALLFAHGKIHEVEHENVGVEGGHKGEELVEHQTAKVIRSGIRHHKMKPYKAVEKAERQLMSANAEYFYQKSLRDNPQIAQAASNPISRMWQKRRIKQQYAKAARQAGQAAAQGAAATAENGFRVTKLAAEGGERVAEFAARNWKTILIVAVFGLLALLLITGLQSCTVMAGTAGTGVTASSYFSKDKDMLGAEKAYAKLEQKLQRYLDTYEATHNYDEYHFYLDEIEHDPYVLISILSALHDGVFTLAEVQGELEMLFEKQYILTETVTMQIRYRTKMMVIIGPYGVPQVITYQEPYEYYICTVKLKNKDLSHLPVEVLTEEQLSAYSLYMRTLGNRPDLFGKAQYPNASTIKQPTYYDIPPEALKDDKFAAMMEEATKYIGYPYVWGGSSPSTSFDCSGYISWVLNHSGWNVGRQTAQGLYNLCTPVSAAQVKPGDLVFFKGIKMLREAARSDQPEDKLLLWLSRPSGTFCFRERDVLLKDTQAYNTWKFCGEQTHDRILAYAVELTGAANGTVQGNLYELDYQQHFQHIRDAALPVGANRLIYESGMREIGPKEHFDSRPDKYFGEFVRYEMQPRDPELLQAAIRQEQRSREPARPGDFKEHLAALHTGLIEAEAQRIVADMKRLAAPNSPDKNHFMVEVSPYFTKLASSRDTDRLIAMLPYKSLHLSSVKDRFGIYALVDKNENRDRDIRKPRASVRKQLSETKQAASPKKAAARSKQHEMEV